MPVAVAVGGDDAHCIAAYRFFGPVTLDDIFRSSKRVYAQLKAGVPYRALLVFEESTDLSELDQDVLAEILAFGESEYRRHHLGPRAGAAVLNGSTDAKLLMPLFNAIGLTRGGVDLSFKLFQDLELALSYLGIPLETGKVLIAETE